MAPLKLETATSAFRGSFVAIAFLLNQWFELLGRGPRTSFGRFRDEVSDFLRLLEHGNMAGGYRNRDSAGFLRTGFFHRRTECVILRSDHVPRRLRLPSCVREFFVEHWAVDLALHRQDKPTLGHRQSIRKTVEDSLFGHPREMLRINLNGFLPRRGAEGLARIVRRHSNVRNV